MNKENYSIKLEDAKKMKDYVFSVGSTIEELKNISTCESAYDDVPVILEFGNIDIEITIYDGDNGFYLGYYACAKDDNGEWSSYDAVDAAVVIPDSEEKLEKDMFDILMKFAEKEGLYWSKGNSSQLTKNWSVS